MQTPTNVHIDPTQSTQPESGRNEYTHKQINLDIHEHSHHSKIILGHVLSKWLNFHCPAAKLSLFRYLSASTSHPPQHVSSLSCSRITIGIEFAGSGTNVLKLQVKPTATVLQLKREIAAVEPNLGEQRIRLFVGHGGAELCDESRSLEDHAIGDGATLTFLVVPTEHIRVVARFRPEAAAYYQDAKTGTVDEIIFNHNKVTEKYQFDAVFNSRATEDVVYQGTVAPLVNSALDGISSAFICLGFRRTGKFTTIHGPEPEFDGMLPRAVKQLVASASDRPDCCMRFEFFALEVRRHTMRDLLVEGAAPTTVKIRDQKLENISRTAFQSVEEFEELHFQALRSLRQPSRAVIGSNPASVFVVEVELTHPPSQPGAKRLRTRAHIQFVVLESVPIRRPQEERRPNLHNFRAVIDALTSCENGTPQHVPYRNNSVTNMLTHALGGGDRAVLCLTCIPKQDSDHVYNRDEVRRAMLVGRVKNAPRVRQAEYVD